MTMEEADEHDSSMMQSCGPDSHRAEPLSTLASVLGFRDFPRRFLERCRRFLRSKPGGSVLLASAC